MSWQPNQESLGTLATCLRDSLSGFNKTAQKQAEIMLTQAKANPDINNYLAFIFSSAVPAPGTAVQSNEWHLVRSAAAIMLKNNIKSNLKGIPESSLQLIKLAIPLGIQDTNSQIRNFAGNLATEIVRRGGLYSWPELLEILLKMIGNEGGQYSNEAQEGAMAAMAKICEDNTKVLEREQNGQRPLNILLPKCIEATKSPLPKVRAFALKAINEFTPRKNQAMLNVIDTLLQHLFHLAEDQYPDVRREVCRAFVRLVETRPDKLLPHIGGLIDYILTQQKSDDEELATEAAEFWLAVGEHDNLWQALDPHLGKIIPVLLECMVYSPEDIALLGGASDDEDEEDRQEDIKPQFAKKNLKRGAAGAEEGANQDSNGYEKMAEEGLEEGEIDDEDEDDDGDDNPDERWTLRKCSAAALDVFAGDFGGKIFNSILPYLQTNLKHEDWPRREAAVLALGAVADGCMGVVVPHLPELVPYLISLLEDPEPVVRIITCWTLSRYSSWAAGLGDDTQRQSYFEPLMEGILRRMLDKNKKVQEAGASAMATLEEKAGKQLEPYCGPIIQQFVLCFSKYKDKNRWVLYDCVQTLAEHIGPVLARPELANQLMPVIIDRWQRVPDQSREMFPLLECLSYIAMALGDAFTPFAEPIFNRCVNIIHQNLEQAVHAKTNANFDQPDKDFLVTSLDLLSAIIQALDNAKAAELVARSQPAFFELLSFCMEDPSDEVQQSAYALVGDCSKYVPEQLRPFVHKIFTILVKKLDLDDILDEEIDSSFSVVNNACWGAGEVAMQFKKEMEPFVPELLQRFVEIISNPGVPAGVVENAAIALGRLGLFHAEILAPHLPKFAHEFLTVMEEVDTSEEKATAFRGFCNVVAQNPQSIENVLLPFFSSIARYQDLKLRNPIKHELHEAFLSVLKIYQQLIPHFGEFLAKLPPQDLQSLKTTYGL
ncbi:armadillo-type protein [Apiosordaria backusii]|uniref:Armadillo-type protein n=1 Tax=Apiosordaria backusii TaxID=314023 RepID=A0AA40BJN4_9PEZI|nr:armadillo-type protein [Apiosordaria backusii]